MTELQIGDIAPNFKLATQHVGKEIELSTLKGSNVVLYFYPKDNTPGCTLQAKDFKNKKEEFTKLNTIILGVSKDDVESHQKFSDNYCLNFDLLADVTTEVCSAYNVWVQKSMFGRKYMGIQRATYLIDTEGKIAHIWPNAGFLTHANEVLKILNNNSAKS